MQNNVATMVNRFFVRLVFLVGVVVIMGDVRCKATAGEGAIRAQRISTEIDEIRAAISSSAIPEEERKRLTKKLASIEEKARQLGQDVDTNKSIADENAVDAKRMRILYWTVPIALVLLLAFIMRRFIAKALSGGLVK